MRLLVLVLVVALSSCGDEAPRAETFAPSSAPAVGAGSARGDITVFAAASLTESFTAVGEAFEAANPDARVELNFASSSELVAQIGEGAPADVYASADEANMQRLVDAGDHAAPPVVFARNSLAIAVEPGNPLGVEGLADLADPDLVVVTCDPEVPIGAYSEQLFANAGAEVEPDSFEEDVKAVLTKVVLGEADAGIVYSTDIRAAGEDVEGIAIPADVNVTPAYPIAATAEAVNRDGAAAFTEFVRRPAGQQILADFGFAAP